MTNHVNSRIVYLMAKLTASYVHANFSHFYLGILSLKIFCLFGCPSIETQKIVYYCLVIPLWKCEYCLIWALNKSILFGSNSLELSVLSDMNSEKTFYRSFIWSKLSKNVSIAWCKLWKSVYYCLPVTLKISVLLDVSSGKVCSIVWQ